MMSELRCDRQKWRDLLPQRRLGNRTPIQVMLVLHRDVSQMTNTQRALHCKYANARAKLIDFKVGDYVLVSLLHRRTSKLFCTWQGSYQVIAAVLPLVYQVRSTVDDSIMEAHASKIKLYADDALNVTEEMRVQRSYDDAKFFIEEVVDERFHQGVHQAFIKWRGFSDLDNTWEPVTLVQEDAPALWQAWLHKKSARSHSHRIRRREIEDDEEYFPRPSQRRRRNH
jgi:hypothetical protein